MLNSFIKFTSVVALVGATGCSFAARSPDMYRTDTQALLETRSAQIKSCYDGALRSEPTVQGKVRVSFTVEPETGKVVGALVDPAGSTAPAGLGECVIRALDGLELAPPDAQEGNATFEYEFKINPSAPAPAAAG